MIFGWTHDLLRSRERELRNSSELERSIRDSSAGSEGAADDTRAITMHRPSDVRPASSRPDPS